MAPRHVKGTASAGRLSPRPAPRSLLHNLIGTFQDVAKARPRSSCSSPRCTSLAGVTCHSEKRSAEESSRDSGLRGCPIPFRVSVWQALGRDGEPIRGSKVGAGSNQSPTPFACPPGWRNGMGHPRAYAAGEHGRNDIQTPPTFVTLFPPITQSTRNRVDHAGADQIIMGSSPKLGRTTTIREGFLCKISLNTWSSL